MNYSRCRFDTNVNKDMYRIAKYEAGDLKVYVTWGNSQRVDYPLHEIERKFSHGDWTLTHKPLTVAHSMFLDWICKHISGIKMGNADYRLCELVYSRGEYHVDVAVELNRIIRDWYSMYKFSKLH
jgi:hypothetical protein